LSRRIINSGFERIKLLTDEDYTSKLLPLVSEHRTQLASIYLLTRELEVRASYNEERVPIYDVHEVAYKIMLLCEYILFVFW
jgi:hypothetical protein